MPFDLKPQQDAAYLFDRPFSLSMGPQRSGTSWIDRYLRARGDICLPYAVKEVFFFDRQYFRGADFYRSHFKPEANHRMAMEVSATSFNHPDAPQRVFNLFGSDIRLLCPLRHPIPRTYSLYLHYKRFGLVNGDLREACELHPHILDSSHYAKHLTGWFDWFDQKTIHFVYQEDMESNMGEFVTQICNALQIPLILPSEHIAGRYNPSAASPIPALAKSAYDSANWLRQYRMHFVINAAKKVGLKRLILGTERDAGPQLIPPDDRQWLEERLHGQIEALEKLIGPIPQWHENC